MTTYHISVSNEEKTLANADGSLAIMGSIVRELKPTLNADAQFTVKLTRTAGIGEDITSTVLAITADGDTVATLLGSKLRKEKKAANEAADETDGGSNEPEHAEVDQPEPEYATV